MEELKKLKKELKQDFKILEEWAIRKNKLINLNFILTLLIILYLIYTHIKNIY